MNTDLPIPPAESVPTDTPRAGSSRLYRKLIRQACQVLVIAGLAMSCYFLITRFVLQSVRVVGVSMVPTLQDSDRYLLNRWICYVHPPHRSDIVVLRDPLDDGFSVKRVIGVTGDVVSLKGGLVFVNGVQLREQYLVDGTRTLTGGSPAERTFRCGKDEFFVLGDNRGRSVDSRMYGPVPRHNILGVIVN